MQLIHSLTEAQTGGSLEASMSLSRYCTELTPFNAQSHVSAQLSLLRKESEKGYLKAISLLIIRLTESLNITNTLSVNQIADLAVRIGKRFYYLRLPELMYVFQRASDGAYGSDYNRLDAAKVLGWIERYDLEERLTAIESQRGTFDETAKPLNDEQLTAFYKRVADGEKTVNTEHLRNSERNLPEAAKFAEARLRYVKEKNASAYGQANAESVDYENIQDQEPNE